MGHGWHALTPSLENVPDAQGRQELVNESGTEPGWQISEVVGGIYSNMSPVASKSTPLKATPTLTLPTGPRGNGHITVALELEFAATTKLPNRHWTCTDGSTGNSVPERVTMSPVVKLDEAEEGTKLAKVAPP